MGLVPSFLPFLPFLQPFGDQMTAPAFAGLPLTVLAGWALCRRRHTVSGALCCGIAAGGARVAKHRTAPTTACSPPPAGHWTRWGWGCWGW